MSCSVGAKQSMHSSGSMIRMRLEHVDAVDRADVDAREIFDVDAGLGDDVRHASESSLSVLRLYSGSVTRLR